MFTNLVEVLVADVLGVVSMPETIFFTDATK